MPAKRKQRDLIHSLHEIFERPSGYNPKYMTARLPVPGSDNGTWGDTLNAFLEVGHTSVGLNYGSLQETLQSGNYTLAATDSGTRIVVTAAVNITTPTVGMLGNGFECEIVNDSGGTVTIIGPGATNVFLSPGNVACILEVNGKQRVSQGPTTVIS